MQAILSADLIVIGPGSLYTSILPNLLVPDISQAVRAGRALKIYICNVATQPGETLNYSCSDHVRALQEHTGGGLFDLIVVNNEHSGKLPENSQWVIMDDELKDDYPVYSADLVDDERPWRHESEKLARVLMDLLEERTGPLVE